MATIIPTITAIPEPGNPKAYLIAWGPMQNGDVGGTLTFGHHAYADRSVQVEGTFGVGGNVAFEGSNDTVNFHPLTNPQTQVLNITAASINAVVEVTNIFRPHVTAGDGTTSLNVTMYLRRATPGL